MPGVPPGGSVKRGSLSKPLPRLHQTQIHQLPGMPLERLGVVPLECGDVIAAAGIALQRLGRAERADRRRDVVMPFAGVGVVFLVVERVVAAQLQPRFGAKQRNTVDLAAVRRHMFLEPPAQPTKEIKLPFLGVPLPGRILARQRVIARAVQMRLIQ